VAFEFAFDSVAAAFRRANLTLNLTSPRAAGAFDEPFELVGALLVNCAAAQFILRQQQNRKTTGVFSFVNID
jgi:hypothetical protein